MKTLKTEDRRGSPFQIWATTDEIIFHKFYVGTFETRQEADEAIAKFECPCYRNRTVIEKAAMA